MGSTDLSIGQFSELYGSVIAAEVHGEAINRASAIIGTRPPFRDISEIEFIKEDDDWHVAQDLAIAASGADKLARKVEELDPAVELVLFSKTGALALKSKGGIPGEAYDLIESLNGGLAMVFCPLDIED